MAKKNKDDNKSATESESSREIINTTSKAIVKKSLDKREQARQDKLNVS